MSITTKASPGIVDLFSELHAAYDVARLNFSDRGEPLSDAKTGEDLFKRAKMAPLSVHTREGMGQLIHYLKKELDKGGLGLENLNLSLAQEPYYLRERFGTLLSAINARVKADMGGVNLCVEMSPASVSKIREEVKAKGITADTFQLGATNAYLDLLRLRKLPEADAFVAAFSPREGAGAAVFDLARVPERVLFEAFEDGKFRAIQSLGHGSDREKSVKDLEALVKRGRMDPGELKAVVHKTILAEARFSREIDPSFQRFVDPGLQAQLRAQYVEDQRRELGYIARGSIYTSVESLEEKVSAASSAIAEGLITQQELDEAIRAGYVSSLAANGKGAELTQAYAAQGAAKAVSRAEIDAALETYAASLAKSSPSAGWVAKVAEHARYFPSGTDALILGSAYQAQAGMHRDDATLKAIAEHFPKLDLGRVGSVLPPVFIRGIDLRGALQAELDSPDARALATVFTDWYGPGSASYLSEHDPLSPAHKIGQMREACVALLALPKVRDPGQGLLAAINAAMVADGSTTKERLKEQEAEDHAYQARLGDRIRAALGGELDEVPYVALAELQSALAKVNQQIKDTFPKKDT